MPASFLSSHRGITGGRVVVDHGDDESLTLAQKAGHPSLANPSI
jgi:hypothetical protein